jgi:hypothetical protein
MDQPEGFEVGDGTVYYCRMRRVLYGLRQVPRVWNEMFHEFLISIGFVRSEANHCLYTWFRHNGNFVIIIVYVDDMLQIANHLPSLHLFQVQLNRRFDMTYIGPAEYILGIQIIRDRIKRTIHLCQAAYIHKIANCYSLTDTNSVSTPLSTSARLTCDMSPRTTEEREAMRRVLYLSTIGSMMYTMLGTRLDIAYSVGVLVQYRLDPSMVHWAVLKRVIRYLKGTEDLALMYRGEGSSKELVGWCDSDWASDVDTRRLVAGYVYNLNGSSVLWSSKKQPTVVLSTAEAEYMVVTQATHKGIWLQSLLSNLSCAPTSATILHSDNQSSIALACNPIHHACTKHIDIQHHFIQEHIESSKVDLRYVSTHNQVADILTKPLLKDRHYSLLRLLGLQKTGHWSGSVESKA